MTPERHQASSDIAAPLIFFFILALHLLTQFLGHIKKRGSQNSELIKLRQEIKQLLKEASSLLVPSTFAKAAKLRRVAAEKEKELLRIQKSQEKDKLWAFDFYLGSLQIVKWEPEIFQTCAYFGLIWWFWGVPVAVISRQLLDPFGRLLSWKAGDSTSNQIKVGIIPWLILTSRVSTFLCQKVSSGGHQKS
ncbi:hypothetical protein AMTRI_Chr09g14220 [Amborella trichopoda]